MGLHPNAPGDQGTKLPGAAQTHTDGPAAGRSTLDYTVPVNGITLLTENVEKIAPTAVASAAAGTGFSRYKITEVKEDTYTATNAAESSESVTIVKTYALREDTWNNKEIVGIKYKKIEQNLRLAENVSLSTFWLEKLLPPDLPIIPGSYAVAATDTEYLQAFKSVNGTGMGQDKLLDANAAGRHWVAVALPLQALVTAVGHDTLTVDVLIDGVALADLSGLKVQKPYDIRQSTWNGQTINQNYYTAWTSDRRKAYSTHSGAGGVEYQIVIPPYINSVSRIWILRSFDDTGWIDTNNTGRAWCRSAVQALPVP